MKKKLALLLAFVLTCTLLPAASVHAAAIDDSFAFKIQGSIDGTKYKDRDTMKIEFQGISRNDEWFTNIQAINIAYDNELFELVSTDGAMTVDELAEYSQTKAPAQRFTSATPGSPVYTWIAPALSPNINEIVAENVGTGSCKYGYIITQDEKTGFLQMQANSEGVSYADYTTFSIARLAFRPGKSLKDVTSTSIRLADISELPLTNQAFWCTATNGNGLVLKWGQKDPSMDNMAKPLIDYPGIDNKPAAEQTPTAPTDVQAKATGAATAEISWTAPTLSTGVPAVTGYAISADGFAGLTVDGTETTAQLTGLEEGKTYTFKVAAGNKNGFGAQGQAAAITTWTAPAVPTGLSVKVSGSEKLTYQWNKPTANGGNEIVSYKLYVYTGSLGGAQIAGSPFTVTPDAEGGGEQVLTKENGIANGIEYFAKVAAVNGLKEGTAAEFAAITAKNQISAAEPVFSPNLPEEPISKSYGDSLELTVAATAAPVGSTAAPVITYQWYKAESAVGAAAEGIAIAGATAATYKVDKLIEVGSAEYYCVATNLDKGVDVLEEAIRGSNTTTASSLRAKVTVSAKAPEVKELTLTPGNKKLDAKWNVEANGAEATYELLLTHEATTQSAVVNVYEYLDEAAAAQTIRVTEGAVSPTFTSGSSLWVTVGATAYPVATKSAVTVEVTPAGIVKDYEGTTTASAMSFTELTNGTTYTLTLTAKNSEGSSEPVTKTAAPKASSGGGGGGGGSSSGAATTGTDIKKEIPSSGSVSISTRELKDAKSIEAKNAQITVALNQQAVNALDQTTGLIIKTEKKSGASMNSTAKKLLGSRPVFEVTATQNGKAVTSFGTGKITISIAYTPASGENTGKLGLYYINDKGEAEKVSGSKYDATLKAVTGQTNHLSLYAVGYDEEAADGNTPDTSKGLFRDISSSDWFYTAVMELASKEILSGVSVEDAQGNPTGVYHFKPQNNVTRAEFATMLAKAAGADLMQYSTKVFNDVSVNDWYAGAIAWANSVGVASGTGNGNFTPTANITRQDMAVMVSKYIANVSKTTLTARNEKVTFTDAAQIAEYAKSAVESMQTAGVISGLPNEDANGKAIGTYEFRPSANATRAEAAAMLNGLLKAL